MNLNPDGSVPGFPLTKSHPYNKGQAAATPRPGDPTRKENNPKDAFGALKVDYTLTLWTPVLYEMSIGMAAGGFKYGLHNYLAIAPSAMTYVGAAKRHLDAFVGGEMWDPNAGKDVKVRHVIAAMNSLHVLAAAIINENWDDDRPPACPEGFIDALNEQMVILKRNNPDPVARYLREGKRGPGRVLAAQPVNASHSSPPPNPRKR